ncbi:MAG: GntR family transcriptional regulator [Anaerolineae bacterium]
MKSWFPRELQQRFERAIISGEYAQGTVVTAADLTHRFQAAWDEARQVLDAAYRKGLVDRNEPTPDQFRVLGLPQTNRESVFTHTARSGWKPRSQVREVVLELATAQVADRLKVKVGSPVYRYVRTRYVEEQALANQINYMPLEICPGLEEDDVSRYSFQKLLEDKYATVLTEMKEHFTIVPATEEDREVLELPEGSSVLVVERVALGATGQPLIWATIRIRPDRYSYVAELWPEAARLLKEPHDLH